MLALITVVRLNTTALSQEREWPGPPINMQTMLRIYFLQQWHNLSDPGVAEALYDMESMRRFAHIELIDDAIPDETTILNFRRIIEKHQLSVKILAVVNEYCMENNITISPGTMVDATTINAPSSTKNKEKKRDPEMHQTRKGKQWYFGMKMHIATRR